MGEASRRGSDEQRSKDAIRRRKSELIEQLGGRDEKADSVLRSGIAPFLERLSPDEWERRRLEIVNALNQRPQPEGLALAEAIRVSDDEIAWYLFLCQQALEDPLCVDSHQLARAAPFFAGIGQRWSHSSRVAGLEKKIYEVLHRYKKEPDGLIFEILTALAYAEAGWIVEFLDEQPQAKTPDMRVTKGNVQLYVECKRLARRTGYSDQERTSFLRLWDASKDILVEKRQWVWFKGVIHVEVDSIDAGFLADIFRDALPINESESTIYDGPEATIQARLIDKQSVKNHLAKWRIKADSPMIAHLLGGDWAPANSSWSVMKEAELSHVVDCEIPLLGRYIENIQWACGFTRYFDAEISLQKKARDITKHLAKAVEQVPADLPSVIHIAAETLEGSVVERLRTEKVMAKIPQFVSNKPVVAVRFHRFQANQTIDKLWEFDETVEKFQINGMKIKDIPQSVVVPDTAQMKSGRHWELYPSA